MKNAKAFLSIVLSIALMLSIVTVSSAVSIDADVPSINFVQSDNVTKVGDILTIDVAVSENSRLCSTVVDVVYDSLQFEFIQLESKNEFNMEEINSSYSNNTVRFAASHTTYISDDATTIFTLKFKAIDKCADISLVVREAYVVDENDQHKNLTNEINSKVAPITLHSAGEEHIILEPTCETNGHKTYECPCGEYIDEIIPALGHAYDNYICTVCGETRVKVSIKEPSRTTIRSKDGIILHAIVDGAENDVVVKWTANNQNFEMESNGNDLTIISEDNGYTTFKASLYNSNGEFLTSASIEMRSKAGFFNKIGGFFRSLFGTDKIYEY